MPTLGALRYNLRRQTSYIALSTLLAIATLYIILSSPSHKTVTTKNLKYVPETLEEISSGLDFPEEKIGIVTYLTSRSGDNETDHYYDMTRLMVYKLLHYPKTKIKLDNCPLVVLVTRTVTEKKRQRLQKDGALVIEVENIDSPGDVANANPRWIDTMTKLRIWQLVQFDRMLFMDSDIFVIKRLDGIFDDPASHVIPSVKAIPVPDGEAPIDDHYLMAASDFVVWGRPHTIPVPADQRFNTGFFMFKPSLQMFEHLHSISQQPEGKFDPAQKDQTLLNYANRRTGPIPWARLEPSKWVANFPHYSDYKHGVATLHDKMWKILVYDRRLVDLYEKELADMRDVLGE